MAVQRLEYAHELIIELSELLVSSEQIILLNAIQRVLNLVEIENSVREDQLIMIRSHLRKLMYATGIHDPSSDGEVI